MHGLLLIVALDRPRHTLDVSKWASSVRQFLSPKIAPTNTAMALLRKNVVELR
jgi:hypothetical protein